MVEEILDKMLLDGAAVALLWGIKWAFRNALTVPGRSREGQNMDEETDF